MTTATFYARVLVGGTAGPIVVRPEVGKASVRLTVDAAAGPTYSPGQRVLVVNVPATGARPCVICVLQPYAGPWATGGSGATYDT